MGTAPVGVRATPKTGAAAASGAPVGPIMLVMDEPWPCSAWKDHISYPHRLCGFHRCQKGFINSRCTSLRVTPISRSS